MNLFAAKILEFDKVLSLSLDEEIIVESSIDEDALCSYVIDYHTGFGGRKFIASILSFRKAGRKRYVSLL